MEISVGKIKKKTFQKEFTIIPNEPLQRKDLSWKAKGLLSYLLSLPEDWEVFKTELQNHSTDGRDSTSGAFDELVKFGYITKEEVRSSKGHFKGFDYTVFSEPQPITDFPKSGKPISENPISEKPTLQRKKTTTKKQKTKETLESPFLMLGQNICWGYLKGELETFDKYDRIIISESVTENYVLTQQTFEKYIEEKHQQHIMLFNRLCKDSGLDFPKTYTQFIKKYALSKFNGISHLNNAFKKFIELNQKEAPATTYKPAAPLEATQPTKQEKEEIAGFYANFLHSQK